MDNAVRELRHVALLVLAGWLIASAFESPSFGTIVPLLLVLWVVLMEYMESRGGGR